MAMSTETRPWDFSHALDLVNAMWGSRDAEDTSSTAAAALLNRESGPSRRDFATEVESARPLTTASHNATPLSAEEDDQVSDGQADLGKLSDVFQYLGIKSKGSSTGASVAFEDQFPIKIDYASDGATYVGIAKPKDGKSVWQHETDIDEGNVATDRSASPPRLSKKARWRRNKRLQKASFKGDSLTNHNQQHVLVSDSEADHITKRTPARKASAHFIRSGFVAPRSTQNPVMPSGTSDLSYANETPKKSSAPEELHSNSKLGFQKPLSPIPDEDAPEDSIHDLLKKSEGLENEVEPIDPPVTPKSSLRFFPASVQPQRVTTAPAVHSRKSPPLSATKPSRKQYTVEPTILRSGEDRNWALLLKLIQDFPEDRGVLVSPMNLTNHNNHPKGIHVFVDASNIFIGFMEQLKRSQNIPLRAHMTKFEPSFDALALLIERRRPVSRRVLVGSTPENSAFDKARAVGYQCSILQKVWKARELTERQIFFRDQEAGLIGRHVRPPPHAKRAEYQDYSSGTETTTPQYAPPSYVEQGVDEILHMNMMQSMLDHYDEPTTMVLATGDAAAAEYSDGFMAVVERALNKGWKVELYSWSRNINGLYKSQKFLSKWGSNFRITYLDEYAELLLDM